MTVSNVVNARPGQVSKALAAQVLQACRRLGYRPNATARRLRTDRLRAIGLVIVDPSQHYLSDPLTAALLAGLNDCLRRHGHSTVLSGVPPGGLESLSLLREIESDGICLLLSGDAAERAAIIHRMARLGQPLVLIQDDLPDSVADGASVCQDDRGGGQAVARHLFASFRPRQAVMLVPGLEWPAMRKREDGIRDVLASLARPPVLHVLRCGAEDFDETQAALAAHIDQHGVPDLLIGGNDRMAIAGMKLLQGRGIQVPGRVRVTGFNGLDAWRYATPALTTVISPAYELGALAGTAMLRRLSEGRFPFRSRVLQVQLAPQASSSPGTPRT
jgi:LacI family transcriptional regulator